jgi:hypothetical protein
VTAHIERNGETRRAAMKRARQSRRPSRLGEQAGATAKPDRFFAPDAGFPGLLAHVWREATETSDLRLAVRKLLTLDGHVPADIQLRALRVSEEAAFKALFGLSWRDGGDQQAGYGEPAVFTGELGLTTGGRVAVRGPSQGPLADQEDLVDGVIRVPWSSRAIACYQQEMRSASERHLRSVADCRRWLTAAGSAGRGAVLEQLKEAAVRTAPFVLYQGAKRYTNFRERNTLSGKTLWPGHPDCALSSLDGMPVELWSDNDVLLVMCLMVLVKSAGYARIEEANGTQLTLDHVAQLLERTRQRYNVVPEGRKVEPITAEGAEPLIDLAESLARRRAEISKSVQLYREIHGPLMHKIERIAGETDDAARRREALVCAHLRDSLPVAGATLTELAADIARAPEWLAKPHDGFGTGLESVVYQSVCASLAAFDADFAMSRGMRSLPDLVRALRAQDWARISEWELPEFFCCVVPAPDARRYFGDSLEQLADIAWSMSARMQYNSWHFIAGNLPRVPEVLARDHFVPPTIPDIAYFSDQHHNGHVAAKVRFSIRSPQKVVVLDRAFTGFVDLRLLRCAGRPFDEQDLLAAHRVSAFIAEATTSAARLAADGVDFAVESFDPAWHWSAIGASPAPVVHK